MSDELSYGEKLAAEYNLTVYCWQCDRDVKFDPSGVIETSRPIGARFRCSICHGRGLCIVSPKWRANTFGEMIPYGTPPNLPPGFYGFTPGEPQPEPIKKRRRRRR